MKRFTDIGAIDDAGDSSDGFDTYSPDQYFSRAEGLDRSRADASSRAAFAGSYARSGPSGPRADARSAPYANAAGAGANAAARARAAAAAAAQAGGASQRSGVAASWLQQRQGSGVRGGVARAPSPGRSAAQQLIDDVAGLVAADTPDRRRSAAGGFGSIGALSPATPIYADAGDDTVVDDVPFIPYSPPKPMDAPAEPERPAAATGRIEWQRDSDGFWVRKWRTGDTWYDLAAKYLGNGSAHPELFAAQSPALLARLGNKPINIYVGAWIRFPQRGIDRARALGELPAEPSPVVVSPVPSAGGGVQPAAAKTSSAGILAGIVGAAILGVGGWYLYDQYG